MRFKSTSSSINKSQSTDNHNQNLNQKFNSNRLTTANKMKFSTATSSNSKQIQSLIVVSLLLNCVNLATCSGVFEINFSSLVDAFGRDLRDDCCSWQNQTINQHHQATSAYMIRNNKPTTTEQQIDSCDPKKCQLIVRICVKNYQSQEIEASQCTFGELTAQVSPSNNQLNQNQNQYHYNQNNNNNNHHHANHINQDFHYNQQQIVGSGRQTINTASNRFDVHYQKLQQNNRANKMQQATSKSLANSQARALRQISFRQSISFPFNFTWPVSNHNSLIVVNCR